MKYHLLPAILTCILFSLDPEIPYLKLTFLILTGLWAFMLILDIIFLYVLRKSEKKKAKTLLFELLTDEKANTLRSKFRTGLLLSGLVLYLNSPVLYLYASLSYNYLGFLYYNYLGGFLKDSTDLSDYLDEEE